MGTLAHRHFHRNREIYRGHDRGDPQLHCCCCDNLWLFMVRIELSGGKWTIWSAALKTKSDKRSESTLKFITASLIIVAIIVLVIGFVHLIL